MATRLALFMVHRFPLSQLLPYHHRLVALARMRELHGAFSIVLLQSSCAVYRRARAMARSRARIASNSAVNSARRFDRLVTEGTSSTPHFDAHRRWEQERGVPVSSLSALSASAVRPRFPAQVQSATRNRDADNDNRAFRLPHEIEQEEKLRADRENYQREQL